MVLQALRILRRTTPPPQITPSGLTKHKISSTKYIDLPSLASRFNATRYIETKNIVLNPLRLAYKKGVTKIAIPNNIRSLPLLNTKIETTIPKKLSISAAANSSNPKIFKIDISNIQRKSVAPSIGLGLPPYVINPRSTKFLEYSNKITASSEGTVEKYAQVNNGINRTRIPRVSITRRKLK